MLVVVGVGCSFSAWYLTRLASNPHTVYEYVFPPICVLFLFISTRCFLFQLRCRKESPDITSCSCIGPALHVSSQMMQTNKRKHVAENLLPCPPPALLAKGESCSFTTPHVYVSPSCAIKDETTQTSASCQWPAPSPSNVC